MNRRTYRAMQHRQRERRGAAEGGDAERVVALSELVLGMFLIGGVV